MSTKEAHDRRLSIKALEILVVLPLFLWIGTEFRSDPSQYLDWRIFVWAAAIVVVDLLPVQGAAEMSFSLSFPIELSAALVFPPPVVALITFIGAADMRELRGEIPPLKALYTRGQIAWSVALESYVFHRIASLESPWYLLVGAVLLAAVAGHVLNVLVVALYGHLQTGEPIPAILRAMHVGIFGEFALGKRRQDVMDSIGS